MKKAALLNLDIGTVVLIFGAVSNRLDSATFLGVRCDKALVEFKSGSSDATRRLVPFSRIKQARSER